MKKAPSPPPLRPTYLILRSPSQQPRERHVNLAPFEPATGSGENKSAEVHGEFSQATAPGVLSLPPTPRRGAAASISATPLSVPDSPWIPAAALLLMSQPEVATVMWLLWRWSPGGRGTVPVLLLCLDTFGGMSDWIQSGSHGSGPPFLTLWSPTQLVSK